MFTFIYEIWYGNTKPAIQFHNPLKLGYILRNNASKYIQSASVHCFCKIKLWQIESNIGNKVD